jgi:hypothetical protein
VIKRHAPETEADKALTIEKMAGRQPHKGGTYWDKSELAKASLSAAERAAGRQSVQAP